MKSYTPQYTRMVDWWKNEHKREHGGASPLCTAGTVQAIDLDWSEKLEVDYCLEDAGYRPLYQQHRR